MVDRELLIKSLKCSLDTHSHDCEGCHYRLLEEWDERIPIPADCEIGGKKYFEVCDTDQMARDSIELLEKIDG